jgi:hypothetical protein
MSKRFVLHNLENPQIGRIGVQTIVKKWGKPDWRKFACNNGSFSGHSNLLGENGKQECDIKRGSYAQYNKNWNIEKILKAQNLKKENKKWST